LFHLLALRNSAMLALLIASVVAQLSRSPTFSSWTFIMRSGLKLALAAAILVWTGRVEPALSAGRHRHLSGAEYRCIRAVLRQSASAIRCSEIFLARHADDRSGNVHRLARLQDQDALRRTDARDDDRRRGRGLDTRVLWPRLQPAPQYEGAPDHRLSRTERN